MQAAVWHGVGPDNFRIETLPRPVPDRGEVLLRVTKCYFGAMHARAVLVGHPMHTPPVVFGRMFAGEIAAVGADVEGIRTGMRVTANPERPCGVCFYCVREEAGHCLRPAKLRTGAMAEYVLIPAPLVPGIRELPDDLPDEHAAFAETLACALQGMELAAVGFADCAVILGDGGVGLSFVQLARLQGATRVILAGKHAGALEAARALGADIAVDVTRESLHECVTAATQGEGADVVFEAVGSSPTYADALRLLRRGGRAIGFGGAPAGTVFEADVDRIHYRSLRLFGSYRYAPRHFRQAVELLGSGRFEMDSILTHTVRFSDLPARAVEIHQRPDCRALVIDVGQRPGRQGSRRS